MADELFEISEVVFEVEGEEHLDIEDEPNDESIEVELVRDGEHPNCLAALQVELIHIVHKI